MGWAILVAVGVLLAAASTHRFLRSSVADRKAFRELCDFLGARASRATAVGEQDGVEYSLGYVIDNRRRGAWFPHVLLTIHGRSRQRFRIVRADEVGFLTKLTGGRSVETGDPLFDRRYRVLSRTPGELTSFFASARQQYAVRKLFESGVRSIVLEGRTLEAAWRPMRPSQLDPIQVRGAIGNLAMLAAALPGFLGTRASLRSARVRRVRGAFNLIPVALTPLGGGTTFWGLAHFCPLDFEAVVLCSLRYSLPLLALFLIAFVSWLRQMPLARREMLMVVLLALLGFPASGIGGALLLNGIGDPGTPAIYSAKAIKTYEVADLLYSHRAVHVVSWRRHHREETVQVPADLFGRIIPHQTALLVVIKPGRLGFEWVASTSLVK